MCVHVRSTIIYAIFYLHSKDKPKKNNIKTKVKQNLNIIYQFKMLLFRRRRKKTRIKMLRFSYILWSLAVSYRTANKKKKTKKLYQFMVACE